MQSKNYLEKRILLIACAATFGAAVADEPTAEPGEAAVFEQLSMPSDTVPGKDGQVMAVDGGNHQVAVFDVFGVQTLTLGAQGSDAGQLESPLGIGLSSKGEVYVADKGNGRIVMFDSRGRAKKHFEIEADGEDVVPIDIAVGPKGRELFITDNANHRVVVTNAKGESSCAPGAARAKTTGSSVIRARSISTRPATSTS